MKLFVVCVKCLIVVPIVLLTSFLMLSAIAAFLLVGLEDEANRIQGAVQRIWEVVEI